MDLYIFYFENYSQDICKLLNDHYHGDYGGLSSSLFLEAVIRRSKEYFFTLYGMLLILRDSGVISKDRFKEEELKIGQTFFAL